MKHHFGMPVFSLSMGTLMTLGFGPWHLAVFAFPSLMFLFWHWRHHSRAWSLSWFWGLGYFASGVSWVYVSLSSFTDIGHVLSFVATFIFCAYLALFPMIGYAFYRLTCFFSPRNSVTPVSQLFFPMTMAICFTLSEWLRSWLFTGFSWLSVGYSQIESPLFHFAPLSGVHGITLIVCLLSAFIVAESVPLFQKLKPIILPACKKASVTENQCIIASKARLIALVAILCLPLSGMLFSQTTWTKRTGSPLNIAILQGNVSQNIKWQNHGVSESLQRYQQLFKAIRDKQKIDLTILPEAAIPTWLHLIPRAWVSDMTQNGGLIMGSIFKMPQGNANGAVFFKQGEPSQSRIQYYIKKRLVPFGEYRPPLFGWAYDALNIPISDLIQGHADQPLFETNDQLLAVNLCYEALYGQDLGAKASHSTILATLSDTSWFGSSLAQPQFFDILRMRAKEQAKPLIAVNNTGLWGLIDKKGQPPNNLSKNTSGLDVLTVQGYRGMTPYAKWGNWPVILFCFIFLACFIVLRRFDFIESGLRFFRSPKQ